MNFLSWQNYLGGKTLCLPPPPPGNIFIGGATAPPPPCPPGSTPLTHTHTQKKSGIEYGLHIFVVACRNFKYYTYNGSHVISLPQYWDSIQFRGLSGLAGIRAKRAKVCPPPPPPIRKKNKRTNKNKQLNKTNRSHTPMMVFDFVQCLREHTSYCMNTIINEITNT